MWDKTNLKHLGETLLKVKNPRPSTESEVKFIVVQNGFTNLLGLNTIQELGFITINKDQFISQVFTHYLVIWARPPSELMKVLHLKYLHVGKSPLQFKMW